MKITNFNYDTVLILILAILFSTLPLHANSDLQNLKNLEQERYALEIKNTQLANQISDLEIKMLALKNGLSEKKLKLSNRIQSIHQLSSKRWNLLSGLTSPSELQRVLSVLQKLNIKDVEHIKEQIYKTEELKKTKSSLISSYQIYKSTAAKISQKMNENNLVEQTYINKLKTTQTPSLLLFKGQLNKPINAKIITPYGSEKNKSFYQKTASSKITEQYNFFHSGVTFATENMAKSVQAISLGEVIFSDVLAYWGESIIIQHDDEYYSVYTNVKNIQVSVGQKVFANEQLAETNGRNFYFELRHATTPLNPSLWIKDFK